jgi:hypothetical protein
MGHDGPLSPQAQIRGVYMNTGSVDIGPDPGTLVSWLCSLRLTSGRRVQITILRQGRGTVSWEERIS